MNLTAESYRKTDFKKPKDIGRFAVDMLLLYTLPSVMADLMRKAIVDALGGGGDDDDESFIEFALKSQLGYMLNTLVGVREIQSGLNAYGYTGPAGISAFGEMGKFIKQALQMELDEGLLKSVNKVAGLMFHYPAGQVERTAEGIYALSTGNSENPGVLITGTRK